MELLSVFFVAFSFTLQHVVTGAAVRASTLFLFAHDLCLNTRSMLLKDQFETRELSARTCFPIVSFSFNFDIVGVDSLLHRTFNTQ